MEISPLQQSQNYAEILAANGVVTHRLPDDGTYVVQRGPVVAATRHGQQTDLHALRRYSARRITVVNPETPAPAALRSAGFRQMMTGSTVAQIDLSQSIQPHPKWARSLRHAKDSAVVTQHRPFTPKDHWIFTKDAAHQKAKKFRNLPHFISRQWPKTQSHFALALLNGTPVAAMLFLAHGRVVSYQIGWADQAGRDCCAHHLLLSQARAIFADQGFLRLDLGTIDTVNAAGLARFKLRAGAAPRQLGGTWAALPLMRS